jgi:hypothetical protein
MVYLNGVLLTRGVDYVATTGSSITGLVALSAADLVEVVAFSQINAIGSVPSANSTFLQSGTGAVQRTVDSKLKDVVSAKDFGAGAGGADDSTKIQAAIDALAAAGGGTLYFPAGTYNLQAQLIFPSNVHYKGEGKQSLLKVNSTPGPTYVFNQASADVDNVVFDGLGFDGSINYPANSQVYKQTYANVNAAIRTGGIKATRIVVQNCFFNELSLGAIDINGFESSNITIQNNYFYKASYRSKVINVRLPSDTYTDAQRVSNVTVRGNHIEVCGPQYHYDPSKEDWTASADAISFDSAKDCLVTDNVIKQSGGIGIRVEESLRVTVANNKIVEPGQDGISFYKNCYDCSCTGNTVEDWGRTPLAYAIRNYSGTYVVAREFPRAAGPTLPANPTAATWFETWPYTLANIDTASIISYSASDYYTAINTGILPFRGYSAISVTNESAKVSVVGNNCVGNLSTDGSGKYFHASDFGFTPVHSANDATTTSGENCLLSSNGFVDCRVYRIYHPEYHDRINSRGLLGTAIYAGNRDSSSLIHSTNPRFSQGGELIGTTRSNFIANEVNFPATQVASANANTLDDYEEGVWTAALTSGGGSITMDTGFDGCSYTKIGRLVTVTGEIRVSSVSSPTGALSLTGLPFAVGNISDRGEFAAAALRSAVLTGTTTGVFFIELAAAATSGTISRLDNNVFYDAAANMQATSRFTFSFSYIAAT